MVLIFENIYSVVVRFFLIVICFFVSYLLLSFRRKKMGNIFVYYLKLKFVVIECYSIFGLDI